MTPVFLLMCLAGASFAHKVEWNYNNSSPYGPKKWPTIESRCGGSSQSPIDIKTANVQYDKDLGQLQFTNYDRIPSGAEVKVSNNGHSLQVSMLSEAFFVYGGGLDGNFSTVQFHFHWGSDSSKGSEHLVNGKAHAGAIHIVSYNHKYPNISVAVDKSDGLSVIGVFLEIGDEATALNSFLDKIDDVINVGNTSALLLTTKLQDLLPSSGNFFRYKGSLTTPNCQQSVQWTVMQGSLKVSEAQMAKLRKLKQQDGVTPLVNNFRHAMPLNDRTVKSNFDHGNSGTATMSGLVTIVMATVLSIVVSRVF